MKKHIALLAAAMFAGVAAMALAEEAKTVVRIRGSNTFGEELGPLLIKSFQQANPEIEFELGTEGSGDGIRALLSGDCDIASASRIANEDELRLARTKNVRLRSNFLGYYGVAVIVNSKNPVRSLTHAQIRDIFTGAITNWKEVGGKDGAINLYIRDPVSGTYLGFQELAMDNRPYAKTATQLHTYHEIADEIAGNPNGIGYTGMTLVPKRGVTALQVNGIPANAVSVNEGLYPYARGLRLYTITGKTSDAAFDFIRFVRGREGQGLMEKNGYVPRLAPRVDMGMPGF
jgi:phosphate transport system substrate-binding protein